MNPDAPTPPQADPKEAATVPTRTKWGKFFAVLLIPGLNSLVALLMGLWPIALISTWAGSVIAGVWCTSLFLAGKTRSPIWQVAGFCVFGFLSLMLCFLGCSAGDAAHRQLH